MDRYRNLYEISQALHGETDLEQLPKILLEKLAAALKAQRGFIVVREGDDYTERCQIHFERGRLEKRQRRFSRSMVREAIDKSQVVISDDMGADDRVSAESIRIKGGVSVLAAPLFFRGEVVAVAYIERDAAPFDDEDRNFIEEFAELAGMSLHIALERLAYRNMIAGMETESGDERGFHGIIGQHPKMKELLRLLVRVADSQAGILINGETGTGKELIARAIYRCSPRRARPFVTVHCGALPETLLESELWGHKRGAYSGAVSDRVGRFAMAHGGTLFIDEVAEIPLTVQAKLLRFIQFGEFQRLGSDRVEQVDVRIVAATHRDIAKMVAEGSFREDLYYRLKVVSLKIPPLRERLGDLDLLCAAFLERYWTRAGSPSFTARAKRAMMCYHWPGNVRELAHAVERACLLASGDMLDRDLLPEEITKEEQKLQPQVKTEETFSAYTNEVLKQARDDAAREARDRVEKLFLSGLLAQHGGDAKAAAEAADMQITYLYRLLARHQMKGT